MHELVISRADRLIKRSSMANVAQGFHLSSKNDFLKYLDYVGSSVAETVSHELYWIDWFKPLMLECQVVSD
jgi:hypothetical protein